MKSDLLAEYKKWLTRAPPRSGKKIIVLRSNSGGEYVSSAFKALHDESGKTHQTTVPDTPQQSGVAERLNIDNTKMERTMLRQKYVDQELWADSIKTAVYIKNRLTSRALPVGKSPHVIWTGRKLDVSHMRGFGSTCWMVLLEPQRRQAR